MFIERRRVRDRIVKGWAFMTLSDEDVKAIKEFLKTGNTNVLPTSFQREDYAIYDD